jgi:hypothetical protein
MVDRKEFHRHRMEQQPMLARRAHQTIRTAALTLATIALLVSGYVSSYYGTWWLKGRGAISTNSHIRLQGTVYLPVTYFIASGSPGSETANKLSLWMSNRGSGHPTRWETTDGRINTMQPIRNGGVYTALPMPAETD